MITGLDYDGILEKLKQSGLSEREINEKIEEKMNKLSGLISKEGAAHILANELGVKVFYEVGEIKVKDAKGGMRGVSINGKVSNVFGIRSFKKEQREGRVGSFLMGDETGSIRAVLWDEMHLGLMEKELREGMIIRVENGYIKDNNGFKELHLNNRSELKINPEGVSVGEVLNIINGIEKNIKELGENDRNVTLKGTVVQVFDVRFYETCDECGRRAVLEDGVFKCSQHGNISPGFGWVLNCILDDGTESIRIVCFREQVVELLGVNKDELLRIKDAPGDFEPIKETVLGKQIKIVGRAAKNTMFDRLEFITSHVEELTPERLLKEAGDDI